MSFSPELISIGIAGITCLVWLVRLEGRILGALEKISDMNEQVWELEKKHDALDTRIMDKLSVIERSLAKIEGQLITRRDREHEQ
jgi:hypothetical protein